MTAPESRQLPGGSGRMVRRVGDRVERVARPWTPTVHALLDHLREAGFDAAPEVLTTRPLGGIAALRYVEGESPHPHAWSDAGIERLGRLVRCLHDLSAGFDAPDASWSDEGLLARRSGVIGHGDLAPWNVIAREGLPVAIVDWETAGPLDPLDEVAYAGWLNAQLHDDDVAERVGLPSRAARVRQLGLFLDAYGLDADQRVGFVDRMVALAVESARQEAIRYGVTPDAEARSEDGYPVLWSITWRVRSAGWMLDHRDELTAAIEG